MTKRTYSSATLLAPLVVRHVTLPNRVVMAPMTTRFASADGSVTERLIAYYEARAAGGVGLVTVELGSPLAEGAHRRCELGVHDDRFLPGLRRLTERLHAHGAKCAVQIGHAGAHARPDVTGAPAVSPSAVAHDVAEGDVRRVRPRPLRQAEIRELVEAYAACAERCHRAGFDIVELQGGHDYLIAQFLSPLDNQRDDEYGGPLRNRGRFALEVVRACRARTDGALGFRFSADEVAPGGFTLDDARELAPLLQDAGIDLLSVSAGSARSVSIPWLITTPMAYPEGLFVPLSAAVKALVDVPVAVVGRLHDPARADAVLRAAHADLIVLGRALLAEPRWARHVREGRPDRIRPCIACNTCVDHLRSGRPVRCLVNPEVGREASGQTPARIPEGKSAVVLGAGPAGLTAAATLGEAGCRVRLVERAELAGGRLRAIPRGPRFQVVETAPEPFGQLIDYLLGEVHRSGVQLECGQGMRVGELIAARPDIVVVATGARYAVPGLLRLLAIPGMRRLAAHPRLHKHFFKLLRQRRDFLPQRLRRAGLRVEVVGDRSGSRGVEAAIRSGHDAALRVAAELSSRRVSADVRG